MVLPVGAELAGRYRVVGVLGEGGMGTVYRVTDLRRRGTDWALKELTSDPSLPPDEIAAAAVRFEAEIALLRRVHHPLIPAFVDAFRDGGRRYFVMELIPGETLEQRLEHVRAPLPERDVLGWALDMCDVLTYLHGLKPPVIVRDLKPGNIMVTPHDQARLIDLGIARTFKPGQTSNTENLGTAVYASPEHHGRAQTDARSDIYSLGATMYHLLTNHEPAPLESPAIGSLRRNVPSLNPASEAVVVRAMQLDPAARYQTAQEFAQALREALRALPPEPRALSRAPVLTLPIPAPGSLQQNSGNRLRQAPAATAAPSTMRQRASAGASAASAASSTATPATPYCPNCGFANRPGAKYCAQDGTPLVAGLARPRVPTARPAAAPITRIVSTSTAQLKAQHASQSFSSGRYMQAIRLGEEAIAQGHATYETYTLLGRAYLQAGRVREAGDAFSQAGRLRPSAEVLVEEARARVAIGDLPSAQIAFTKARQLDPADPAISYELGRLCLQQGQLAQAEGELREGLARAPEHAPTLTALGEIAGMRHDWAGATELYRQAIAADEDYGLAHFGLGQALLAAGRLAEAVRALEAATRHMPDSADAWFALAMTYHATGRRAQARKTLKRTLEIDPANTEAQRLAKQI